MPQIHLAEISKRYRVYERPSGRWSTLRGAFSRQKRIVQALSDIGFDIQAGELVGYIGPNGAGKSTTIKIMSGILTPDGGECTILGRTPWKQRREHVAQIGVVFGQRSQLWWDVPVMDSFSLLRDIYAIRPSAFQQRLDEMAELLDIGGLLGTPVRQLSLGQRMRCELVAALLHRPQILFLDEPTIGLDAVSKLTLRSFLKRENEQSGMTMLLTTHDMDDIYALCNRVMVIGHGRLLYDGDPNALRTRYAGQKCLQAAFSGPIPSMTLLAALPGVSDIQPIEPGSLRIAFDPKAVKMHVLVARLSELGTLDNIAMPEQDIDEVIATMYKEMAL